MGQIVNKQVIKQQRAAGKAEREKKYRRAKAWQMAVYPIGGFGHNAFMFLMGLVSYYAAGIVGLGTVVASLIITGSRIMDAVTDPVMGILLDRTNGRFGKVRPALAIAYILMASSTLLLFYTNHLVPDGFKIIYFILLYFVFIIGYAMSQISLNIGNAVITNDPEQRPLFGGLTMIYTMIFTQAPLSISPFI